jgi:hypothetical protein
MKLLPRGMSISLSLAHYLHYLLQTLYCYLRYEHRFHLRQDCLLHYRHHHFVNHDLLLRPPLHRQENLSQHPLCRLLEAIHHCPHFHLRPRFRRHRRWMRYWHW